MASHTKLVVRVLETETGLWCPVCLLPSGVAVHYLAGWHAGVIRRCVECHEPL